MAEKQQVFRWTEKATAVALALAAGKTRVQAAIEAGVHESSVYRWLRDPLFAADVDRLSLMTDIASRAERLRIAKRAVRQMLNEETGHVTTERDILDWLKFAQSETDGVKLDLAALADAYASVADR